MSRSKLQEQRKVSLEQAKARFPGRFTLEHVPDWASEPRPSGTYSAPQYATDQEWYEKTIFPGEAGLAAQARYCQSVAPSWPLGQSLQEPFRVGRALACLDRDGSVCRAYIDVPEHWTVEHAKTVTGGYPAVRLYGRDGSVELA